MLNFEIDIADKTAESRRAVRTYTRDICAFFAAKLFHISSP